MARVDEFLKRVPRGALARVSIDISTAFSIVETAKEKIAAVLAEGRLSREGKVERNRDVLSKGPTEHMNQLRAGTERDLAGIRSEREGMRRRVFETNAFSEARKSEVRMWLRSLTDMQRIELVRGTRSLLKAFSRRRIILAGSRKNIGILSPSASLRIRITLGLPFSR